ncbi:helix-turn-helix DNA-binding protein [Gordonia phage Schmidt]|uniref:Helix-turn-helix DNA-binding protein n=1 Tax=Gordonia phage Schmidt TaxID=2301697 RepID=A0A385E2K1_9CAUD|nr:transcriptional repressor [Gordonia phage Schmidt]AXQ65157.1 helix-turn-helix DNA-binding protein [Gordonia phage Schmidt]
MQTKKPATLRVNADAVRDGMSRKRIPNLPALADLLAVSRATMYRTLDGSDSMPNQSVLAGLHSRLGIPWNRLLIVDDPATAQMRVAS